VKLAFASKKKDIPETSHLPFRFPFDSIVENSQRQCGKYTTHQLKVGKVIHSLSLNTIPDSGNFLLPIPGMLPPRSAAIISFTAVSKPGIQRLINKRFMFHGMNAFA